MVANNMPRFGKSRHKIRYYQASNLIRSGIKFYNVDHQKIVHLGAMLPSPEPKGLQPEAKQPSGRSQEALSLELSFLINYFCFLNPNLTH